MVCLGGGALVAECDGDAGSEPTAEDGLDDGDGDGENIEGEADDGEATGAAATS